MLANSWLYHYYTVQSKIQFGMPLESGIRVPPGTPSSGYYSPHAAHPPATPGGATPGLGIANAFGSHHHSHHPHHHLHPHHHPAAAYHHHHPHMGTYGGVYHADSAIELKEDQPLFSFQEPVDYSQVTPPNAASTPNPPPSSQSQKSSQSTTPPPPKKRARKLEPLYLHAAERSPVAAITPEPDCYALHSHPSAAAAAYAQSSGDASVIYATIVPTRPRLPNKTLPPDPADFIEQWNPSPPWSESAQKASLDSFGSSHELSPCITTTPPTPTSATPHQNGGPLGGQTIGPAFSFEWMSDPLVPVSYQQWPPTGDHHQHLSQHLSQSQSHQNPQHPQPQHQHPHQQQHLILHQQQQHQHQQQQQQHQHLALHHGRAENSGVGSLEGGAVVVVPPIPISIPIPIPIPIPLATGHGDASEPVEDRG